MQSSELAIDMASTYRVAQKLVAAESVTGTMGPGAGTMAPRRKERGILTFGQALKQAEPRPAADASQAEKKNYAQRLSTAIATLIANRLRPHFPNITPDPDGGRQEAPARTSKGVKKLDVNYSTPELGLGLGVSIKTINFRDPKTKRYTKNYTRADNELRAEALDYHVRQPYAVLIALVFLPLDSCSDANIGSRIEAGVSSFGQSVRIFRHRAGREKPKDEEQLFERVFMGLYEVGSDDARFFDVLRAPPRRGIPRKTIDIAQLVREILKTYGERNDPAFEWAD